ncbi:MAG TPA: sigma-70 family RNA polymerase sigma factor [Gemmatimonadales bacterium]|nr:sigma-70 family RNA polymerase sigma factor [Gemmatimonadales bacterium]
MTKPAPIPPSTVDDQALIQRVAAGDEQAIGQLYDQYASVLHAAAWRITGETADAEEVLLDALAQAWRDASRYDAQRGSVGAWLMTITRSRALDLIRSRGRRERAATAAGADPEAAGIGTSTWRYDTSRSAEQSERRRLISIALQSLSAAQRQAIELAYYEGLSHSEIAAKLGEPLGTVKTRVRLGLQKLREALRPYYGTAA